MHSKWQIHRQYLSTIALLCLGYFVDFYDLTIFSTSYNDIIKELFHVYDAVQIQVLYLQISNLYTIGIIVGGILFGVLGDKIGRAAMVRYSILLYSVTTIMCTFVHSPNVFIGLRFLMGAGLASELAISSVLLTELLPPKLANQSMSWLYSSGVLGGMTAILLSSISSWQIVFLCGGALGLILFVVRKNILESPLISKVDASIERGDLVSIANSWHKVLKMLKLTLIIAPFYFLLSVMFTFPSVIPIHQDLSHAVHVLLIGFFLGSIASAITFGYVINQLQSYKWYLLINNLAFVLIIGSIYFVNDSNFAIYSILLGSVSGGLPIMWMRTVVKNYGTNMRSTASNLLYVMGRGCGIVFNLMVAMWLSSYLHQYLYLTILVAVFVATASMVAILFVDSDFNKNVDFIEQ